MPPDRDDPHALGFHSYADGSPRGPEPDMIEPPLMAGWAETPAWRQVDAPLPPARPPWAKIAAVAGSLLGVAAAVALGWGVFRGPADTAPPAAPAATTEAAASPALEVVITDPPPPPPSPAAAPLDVLPPSTAAQVQAPPAQSIMPVAPPTPVAAAPRSPEPAPAPSAREAVRDTTASAPPRRFDDCREAPTRATALVCSNMALAEADRRMKRAYAAALAAGIPDDELRRDQDDWLRVREEAARVSPRAVADVYRQRTKELQWMARQRQE